MVRLSLLSLFDGQGGAELMRKLAFVFVIMVGMT